MSERFAERLFTQLSNLEFTTGLQLIHPLQAASAVEQAHMSASAPPSRAAMARSSSSDAHQGRLRSGFHNVLPSLSVAGTILEEGEETDEYTSSGTSLGHRGSSRSEHALYTSAGGTGYNRSNSGGAAVISPIASLEHPYATAPVPHEGSRDVEGGAHMAPGLSPVDTAGCLLYTSPSPRDRTRSRMPSSA